MNIFIPVPLTDARRDTCGGKAATLGALLRAGLGVPDGFVVPFEIGRAGRDAPAPARVPEAVRRGVGEALARMGSPAVAVRSSAADEDAAAGSAAGQYETVLGLRGSDAVVDAVERCLESAVLARARSYRSRSGGGAARPEMAVLVQRLVDADVSGVMFTPAEPDGVTRIEASWGLGPAVVEGRVTPDSYVVAPDGDVRHAVGTKDARVDRDVAGNGTAVHEVSPRDRNRLTLSDTDAVRLAAVGRRVTELLGGPQDIEWAIEGATIWLLQARPVTAALPGGPEAGELRPGTMRGAPGGHGVATGAARVITRVADLGRVRAGDILICPYTDPGWTPLFGVVAGVVTQAGGVLSHAAIVAREHGIPAVLGVPEVMSRVPDGARVTIDGTSGSLVVHRWPTPR